MFLIEVISHCYSSGHYTFCTSKVDITEMNGVDVKLYSEHIDKLNAGWYSEFISQNEDQIQYVFIPIYMMMSAVMWNKHKEKVLKELPERFNVVWRNITIVDEKDLPIWKKELKNLELKKEFYETGR